MNQSWARRRDIVVLITCLAVLAGAPGLWWVLKPGTQAAPPVSSIGARPLAALETAPADPVPQAGAEESGGDAPPTIAGTGLRTAGNARDALPALVLLPTLGLAAEVDRVGVRTDGQVDIPEDGNRVGWYRFGAAPGATSGSTVLVGHRDTRVAGPGVLYRLGEIALGDRIELVREDWGTLAYEVVARESISKAALPVDELFREQGPPVLTIITCGGRYTPGVGYDDNLVVTAVPLDEAPAV